MSDDAGGSENVNGRRMAMVVIGAMPGQHADQRADQRAEEAKAEIGRRQRDREAGGEICEKIHAPARSHCHHQIAIGQPERLDEQQHRERREHQREHRVLAQPHVVGRKTGADHDREARDGEADERQA